MVDEIRKLCKENGIAVKSLEKVLELGNGTIRRWDTNTPSTDKVQKVADFFEVSIDELMGIKKAPTVPDESIDIMAEYMKDFTADEKADVLSYIKFVHSKREQ